MKKRTLAILIIIVLALAGLWLARAQTAPETVETQQPQATSSLVALDGDAQQSATTVQPDEGNAADATAAAQEEEPALDEDGAYTTKEDLAAYLTAYGTLPDNFITKDVARDLGWSGGGLDGYDYGKCIGGDRFGNYEGLLPEESGRTYYECDVDTLHADERGAKRIVFSNDGLIYYTDDHYETFTLLYGTP